MCFDLDSRPPIAPLAGAAIDSERITLRAADGAEFAAFSAHADATTGAAMLILPDVRGLHTFYEELALRFAEAGVEALTIDYFGRTAGTTARSADFDFMSHIGQTQYATLLQDMRAGVDRLREQRGVAQVFAVGFCYGGRLAFLSGSRPELNLSGVIGFYGGPAGQGRGGMGAPIDVAAEFQCPALGLFGGADEGIPQSDIDRFGEALSAAGIENTLISYPGAPHSFFDRKAAEFSDASTDAWRRVLDFVRGHTAPA